MQLIHGEVTIATMPHGRTPPERIAVGYVHGGTVRAEFLASLLAVARKSGGVRADVFLAAPSGPNISEARNLIVRRFLGECRAPWLLMIDTDMVFTPSDVDRLVTAADPLRRPVLGALCYAQDGTTGEKQPTMYELVQEPDGGQVGFARYKVWPRDACMPVSATGAAFLLMHRDALTTVEKASGGPAAPWFRESVIGSALVGEDMTFCLRAGAAGIPVHVHTGIKVGHVKTVILI
jgi:GT2 family glycosyltransferase